jgi:serine/threonine protein kinase
MERKESKILSQGSYGCIYRPGITCAGDSEQNDEYITKIQKENNTSSKETELGKKIQTIPNYSEYFAPIIDACPIQLASIKTNEIGKCEFINVIRKPYDQTIFFESNKIKYVGKDSLATSLLNRYKLFPATFFETFMESYSTILEGISLLNSNGIIHYDLKENNIMCRDSDGRPIIIDFGLSIDKALISDEATAEYFSCFYVFAPEYEAWCIDIAFLSYMVNELNSSWYSSKITNEQITAIIQIYFLKYPEEKTTQEALITAELNKYVGKQWITFVDDLFDNKRLWDYKILAIVFLNYGYEWKKRMIADRDIDSVINTFFDSNVTMINNKGTLLFDSTEKANYKAKLRTYFIKFVGKTWNELLVELKKYQDTWDNYALCIIYLYMINDLKLDQYPKLVEFRTFLKSIVFSLPNERITASASKEKVLELFSTIPKREMIQVRKQLKESTNKIEEIKRAVVATQLDQRKREPNIYALKNLEVMDAK